MPPPLPPTRAPATLGLEVWFACPHCGAPASVDDEVISVACGHCTSRLFLARDQPPVALVECVVREEQQLVGAWIARRLAEYRAELYGVPQGTGGDALGRAVGHAIGGEIGSFVGDVIGSQILAGGSRRRGMFDDTGPVVDPPFLAERLAARERELKASVRLGHRRLLHVPYWHLHGLIVHATLGREKGGRKVLAVRGLHAEESAPAYDTERWNLRDRGLRLSARRVRIMTPADAAHVVALPVAEGTDHASRTIDRWCRSDVLGSLETLAAWGELVRARRELFLRPVWLAQVAEGAKVHWMLVDGQTGLIGGDLTDADELAALWNERGENPLERMRPPAVVLFASRCVECGHDVPHDERAWMRACPRCGTGLAVGPRGLERQAYGHVEPPSGEPCDWVPFWRYRVAVLPREASEPIVTLAELARALGLPPALEGMRGEHLWVPAFGLFGTDAGDRAVARVAQWLHRAQPEVADGAITPSAGRRLARATLRDDEARELARGVLLAACDATTVYRLNVRNVRDVLQESRILLAEPRLVMVPARASGEQWSIADAPGTIPAVIMEGGAALEPFRRTVQSLRAAASEG